ncbi:SGNH/GDSL hydrolase family protein [Acaricomes phytoseiuli]|uniref:SGNH/GDSL hydrolase family protein n=1 Tax=Acaricomes phytoseiuli TaxID=291968 RepID=UPI00222202DA|nr:SGNH/GDSL hydrolase family protein [Acaricomes phytoseiuli]MCW1250489.1 SGNH/GDSL hydrolase family protein [Acaricomes phytoseiuli]
MLDAVCNAAREVTERSAGHRVFVAIGDSFTEGVGDDAPHLPHGVRGWADRVAQELQARDDSWRYANFAIRGKRLEHVICEQLEPALRLRPEIVSIYAGGNDLLALRADLPALIRRYDALVQRVRESGAQALLFTGYPVPLSPLLEPLKLRNAAYNAGVRSIAHRYGAMLVDYWCFEQFQDLRMWADDRLHMSTRGHIYLAAKVLEIIGIPHRLESAPLGQPPKYTRWQQARSRWDWSRRHFAPWLGRRLRGVSSGDGLGPRYPAPIQVPVQRVNGSALPGPKGQAAATPSPIVHA